MGRQKELDKYSVKLKIMAASPNNPTIFEFQGKIVQWTQWSAPGTREYQQQSGMLAGSYMTLDDKSIKALRNFTFSKTATRLFNISVSFRRGLTRKLELEAGKQNLVERERQAILSYWRYFETVSAGLDACVDKRDRCLSELETTKRLAEIKEEQDILNARLQRLEKEKAVLHEWTKKK